MSDCIDLRFQLDRLQKIADDYEKYHKDDEPLDEKAIVERTKQACIEAINKEPFDMSSTEFPYKREHQEEGLNIAIKAIHEVE